MNTLLHGFTEIRQAPLPELDATLHEMEHTQTGARLVWLERDEENKTFGIAFPTLPKDDTGVFHSMIHFLTGFFPPAGKEKGPKGPQPAGRRFC